MTIRKLMLTAVMCASSMTAAFAQSESKPNQDTQMGTPEQRAACRPDVRRHCHKVKPEEGAWGFLACLKENRQKLSTACRTVLESNGQ